MDTTTAVVIIILVIVLLFFGYAILKPESNSSGAGYSNNYQNSIGGGCGR
jgi:hypothetical protein